jgi:hypothetical protein
LVPLRLGSLGMLVANHFVWMRHFREVGLYK